ncbi:MAG: glycosyltransferase, partial [Waddliaceae bacterium]
FWVPTFQARMFKPLFEELGSDEKLDSIVESEELVKKISVALELSLERAEKCFTNIGYPCEKFYPIADKKALERKWGVAEDEIPVFVMMGKNGTHTMQKIFDDLNSEESTLRLKIFFLCGNNSELVEKLHKRAGRSIVVCGILTPDEVNEVMNICSIGISKAGGATVSEAIASKTPLLLMDSFPWEEANAQHLVELGLAVRFNPKHSLSTQIVDAIQLLSDNTIPIEDWRIRLHEQVKPLIQ